MKETSKEFEKRLELILKNYLNKRQINEEVERSWYPFKGQRAPFYSPITDIAIGPFATENQFISEYNRLERKISDLLEKLKSNFHDNYHRYGPNPRVHNYILSSFEGNENARCFISFEIESKSMTRKHKMGSIINATALGRVGVLVGMDEYTVEVMIKILEYLKFLESVGKPTFKAGNIFILTKKQIIDILK